MDHSMQHEIDLFFQFFFYTSVAQTTDVNMLLWRHQPVLHHKDVPLSYFCWQTVNSKVWQDPWRGLDKAES